MRAWSAGLKAAFSSTPHTGCWLGRFAFADGTTVRVSSIQQSITIDVGAGSETYLKDIGFKGATLKFRGDGEVPDGEVTTPIILSGAYDAEDVFNGVFDGMEITLFAIDYSNTANGGMQFGPYEVGEINYDDRGKIASFEVRGNLQRAKEIQVEELSVACRSNLGDQRPGHCKLPLYPDDRQNSHAYAVGAYIRVPDSGNYHNRMFRCTTAGTTASSDPGYNYTIGNSTTDGTAHFICENAWVRSATVATVTSRGDFTLTINESRAVDGWFELGSIKWLTGNNAVQGLRYKDVRVWTQSTARVQLWGVARNTVQVGDTLEIIPGCDRAFATCLAKFANTINFRGENLLPGPDFLNGANG